MISTYFKIELKIIFRKKLYLVISILLPVVFYLLFTSILDMPEEAKPKFYKEYMYSMTVFSLMNFCLLSFPLDLIEERNQGWYKRLMVTPLSSFQYYLVKISKTMCQFLIAIIIIFSVAHFYKDVHMTVFQWIFSALTLWIGVSLFLTLGLIIAQLNDIQKASSFANLLNITLAILGGLAIDLAQDKVVNIEAIGYLIVYSIIFLSIALFMNKKGDVS
ncbi:MAG: ABC transporter permease [Staphylococcus epidermidis]|nr:ABC transporter permease [Staphylococcus epidermidis]